MARWRGSAAGEDDRQPQERSEDPETARDRRCETAWEECSRSIAGGILKSQFSILNSRPLTRRTTEALRHREKHRGSHRKHEDTKTRRPPTHSSTQRRGDAEAQRIGRENPCRGEVPAVVERRAGIGEQGNDSDRKRSSSLPCSPACALGAQTSPLLLPCCWMDGTPLTKKRTGRRNRCDPGASAGGKHGGDGRLRPELTFFPPVSGDRQIAGGSAVNLRHGRFVSARSSLRLCVKKIRVGGRYQLVNEVGGWLCASAPLRSFSSGWLAFVPLCLRVCDVGGCAIEN